MALPENPLFSRAFGFLFCPGYTKNLCESLQTVGNFPVFCRVQVGINLQSCRHALMPEAFADQQRCKPEFNQQAGVAVTKIVHPYLPESGLLAASFHFVLQIMLRYFKQSVWRIVAVQFVGIILYHIANELRQGDLAIAFWRLWVKE